MIQTEELTTKVTFGSNGQASIAVEVKKRYLTLQMLATEKQIGQELEDADKQPLPKVELAFYDLNSIEVVIKALEVLRKNLEPFDMDQYALAC